MRFDTLLELVVDGAERSMPMSLTHSVTLISEGFLAEIKGLADLRR